MDMVPYLITLWLSKCRFGIDEPRVWRGDLIFDPRTDFASSACGKGTGFLECRQVDGGRVVKGWRWAFLAVKSGFHSDWPSNLDK